MDASLPEDGVPPQESSEAGAAEETAEQGAPKTQSASAGGAPSEMGKMVVPDLGPITAGQSANVQAMTAVTKEASQSLQSIVSAQQVLLHSTLQNFQTSIKDSSGLAGMPASCLSGLTAQMENMSASVETFNVSAGALSASTNKNFMTLTQTVEESLGKIEEVAIKFSGD